MKKRFFKKLMAGVLAVVCCLTSVVSAYAASSKDIKYEFDFDKRDTFRIYIAVTSVPYTCTWVRITTSAQKYPSGSALLPGLSETQNNSSFALHGRLARNYTGKMTVYGAHSMYIGGKAYIRYSTHPNV